jgi:hypothetical protein
MKRRLATNERRSADALLRARQVAPALRELPPGLTLTAAAAELNRRSVPSPAGGRWSAQLLKTVRKRIARFERFERSE